jgi:hypothetical protein
MLLFHKFTASPFFGNTRMCVKSCHMYSNQRIDPDLSAATIVTVGSQIRPSGCSCLLPEADFGRHELNSKAKVLGEWRIEKEVHFATSKFVV